MALFTVAELLDEVIDEIPAKEQAPIVRACNKVIRRIHTEEVAPERGTFTTRAKTTTGTVNVTQDSTSVTFSSAVLASTDTLMLVQVAGDSTWFVLTYASTTTGTLSSKWAAASNATATYTIVYPTITFGATVGEVLRIKRVGEYDLEFQHAGQIPDTVGRPQTWGPYSLDTASASPNDDLLRIILNPATEDRLVYSFWFKRRTTLLTPGGATTQTIPFSNLWWEAIVQGVIYFCWKQDGDANKILLAKSEFEAALARTRGSQMPGAIIPPRRARRRMFVYEERPVADA